jgi:phosphoglycolate phosphatase-like HAD superfamily hydrolase
VVPPLSRCSTYDLVKLASAGAQVECLDGMAGQLANYTAGNPGAVLAAVDYVRRTGPVITRQAVDELPLEFHCAPQIDLARSYMVGDSLPDMMAGWAAGCATVLVLTGYGLQIQEEADPEVLQRLDHVAVDLAAAAAWIAGRASA